MPFKINGVEFPIPPTSFRWSPRNLVGTTGDGHSIYPGVREFEMRWGVLDATGTSQLQSFFNLVSITGTVIVDLPKYADPTYNFYSYSGCTMQEPQFGDFFNEHIQNILLIVTNIRT